MLFVDLCVVECFFFAVCFLPVDEDWLAETRLECLVRWWVFFFVVAASADAIPSVTHAATAAASHIEVRALKSILRQEGVN